MNSQALIKEIKTDLGSKTFTKVGTTSEQVAYHLFDMNDGTKKEVQVSEADYDKLAEKDPETPTITGGEWAGISYKKLKFDTPTGALSLYEYAEDWNTDVLHVRVPHFRSVGETLLMKKEEMKDNKLTLEGIERIVEFEDKRHTFNPDNWK